MGHRAMATLPCQQLLQWHLLPELIGKGEGAGKHDNVDEIPFLFSSGVFPSALAAGRTQSPGQGSWQISEGGLAFFEACICQC